MVIAITSNTAWSIYNFRHGLIRALLARGDRVIAIAPADGTQQRLERLGCEVVEVALDSQGRNPASDLRLAWRLRTIYRRHAVDLALHFTIKPVIFGSLAARWAGVPCVSTVTGLGAVFSRESFLRRFVEVLYRVSQRWPTRVFFQNRDDLRLFTDRALVDPDQAGWVPGSGVDLERFRPRTLHDDEEPVFLFIGRMLWDKGVGDLVAAARIVRERRPGARLQLLGPLGVANPAAIPPARLQDWLEEGVVEYLGTTDDVRPHIARAHCVVLPSYYREGTPKSLLEAAAMARPIITTDSVGCRDAVDDGVSGYLCRPRDSEDLARQLERFCRRSTEERREMGRRGREKMERQFDERRVVRQYLRAIDATAGR